MGEPKEDVAFVVESSPEAPPLPEVDPGAAERRGKRIALLVALAAAVVFGAAIGLTGSRLWEVTGTVVIQLSVVVWCHFDAQERDFTLRLWLRVLIFLMALVGFPIYAFRARGWGGFKLLGWGILFVIVVPFCAFLPALLFSWISGVPLAD